eukprot:TRINITY_DN6584_c0_g1_i2.p1 TRINITY_DN6584_c0_g1~~TRINITY_DN6584_c0_g1_i2.p1  ORF type:complete len:864 (+),score=237.09 TRINITY_DN6584_c0_g1_i2:77-2593(+)
MRAFRWGRVLGGALAVALALEVCLVSIGYARSAQKEEEKRTRRRLRQQQFERFEAPAVAAAGSASFPVITAPSAPPRLAGAPLGAAAAAAAPAGAAAPDAGLGEGSGSGGGGAGAGSADGAPGCLLPLSPGVWSGKGASFADGVAFVEQGGYIETASALSWPLAAEVELAGDVNECLAVTLFASDAGKNSPYAIETGAWGNKVRIFPGDKRAVLGGTKQWHTLRIEAGRSGGRTLGGVRFLVNRSLVHEAADMGRRTGKLRVVAHCTSLRVRRVRLEHDGGCAPPAPVDGGVAAAAAAVVAAGAASSEAAAAPLATEEPPAEVLGEAPSQGETLLRAARPLPCGNGCKGLVLVTFVNAAWSGALHAWLLHAEAAGMRVGAPGGGIAVAAVDTELLRWCGRHGVPCFHASECASLQRRLFAAADSGTITRARAQLLGPSWCKPLAVRAVLGHGLAPLLVDVDVVPIRDPLPVVSSLLAEHPNSLWYQCGEREPRLDPRFYGAYDVWPNTGHWLAAPNGSGAALVNLLCEEGEWQVAKLRALRGQPKGQEPLRRPHLPCRMRFLEHVVTSWLRYFSKNGMTDKKGDLDRVRMRCFRYAEEMVIAYFEGNLTFSSVNKTLVGFCRRIKPTVCYGAVAPDGSHGSTPLAALNVMLGDWPHTDAGVRRWIESLCVDLNWSDQETVREFVQPEVLPVLVKEGKLSKEAEHSCLPVEQFPVVYRHIRVSTAVKTASGKVKAGKRFKMVADQGHLSASTMLTLHLTGGGGGMVKYYGGLVRFQIAYRAGVLQRPPCRTTFAGARWGKQGRSAAPRSLGGDGPADGGPCPPGQRFASTLPPAQPLVT